jgi:hypothetical protein
LLLLLPLEDSEALTFEWEGKETLSDAKYNATPANTAVPASPSAFVRGLKKSSAFSSLNACKPHSLLPRSLLSSTTMCCLATQRERTLLESDFSASSTFLAVLRSPSSPFLGAMPQLQQFLTWKTIATLRSD